DLELIDVLWRSDIAAEKGTRQLEPAEQYERDLQLLTEKSVHAVSLCSIWLVLWENIALVRSPCYPGQGRHLMR
ncbi:hypothetical protein ANCDUO_26335, partial [Ancylostoma duodenale]